MNVAVIFQILGGMPTQARLGGASPPGLAYGCIR